MKQTTLNAIVDIASMLRVWVAAIMILFLMMGK